MRGARRSPPTTCAAGAGGLPGLDHARGAVGGGDRGPRVPRDRRAHAQGGRRRCARTSSRRSGPSPPRSRSRGSPPSLMAHVPGDVACTAPERRRRSSFLAIPAEDRSGSTMRHCHAHRHGHRQPAAVREGGGGLAAAARAPRGADRPHRPALRRRAVAGLLRGARRAGARPRARRRARGTNTDQTARMLAALEPVLAEARARPRAGLRRHQLDPRRRAGGRPGAASRWRTSRPACARSTARCRRS